MQSSLRRSEVGEAPRFRRWKEEDRGTSTLFGRMPAGEGPFSSPTGPTIFGSSYTGFKRGKTAGKLFSKFVGHTADSTA